MDSRIYFHQYRRPRNNNPTYASSNVQNSMSFFNGSYFPQPKNGRVQPNHFDFDSKPTQNHPPSPIQNYRQPQPKTYQPVINNAARQQSSKLSNIGQKSLNLDQRSVYNKQSSKFDIINLKPKQYNDGIRQYPWLTVQNRDDVYYKRMNDIYNTKEQERGKSYDSRNYTSGSGYVAGKHTYDMENKIAYNPERGQQSERFTAKMLNHMDQLQHNLA